MWMTLARLPEVRLSFKAIKMDHKNLAKARIRWAAFPSCYNMRWSRLPFIILLKRYIFTWCSQYVLEKSILIGLSLKICQFLWFQMECQSWMRKCSRKGPKHADQLYLYYLPNHLGKTEILKRIYQYIYLPPKITFIERQRSNMDLVFTHFWVCYRIE